MPEGNGPLCYLSGGHTLRIFFRIPDGLQRWKESLLCSNKLYLRILRQSQLAFHFCTFDDPCNYRTGSMDREMISAYSNNGPCPGFVRQSSKASKVSPSSSIILRDALTSCFHGYFYFFLIFGYCLYIGCKSADTRINLYCCHILSPL